LTQMNRIHCRKKSTEPQPKTAWRQAGPKEKKEAKKERQRQNRDRPARPQTQGRPEANHQGNRKGDQ
jgi:hypothetical protein